jgi:predicted transcriptional regulator of viral defense system
VYADRRTWSRASPEHQHLGLVRAAGRCVPGAVVSHRSAALLHGLPAPYGRLGAVRMTVPADDRTSRASAWVQLHRGATGPEHVTEVAGVPATSVARTVVDCFREDGVAEGTAVADAALRCEAVTAAALRRARLQQRRWPGVTRAAVGLRLVDGRRESWLESYSAGVMALHDVPKGVPQVVVLDEWGEFVAPGGRGLARPRARG